VDGCYSLFGLSLGCGVAFSSGGDFFAVNTPNLFFSAFSQILDHSTRPIFSIPSPCAQLISRFKITPPIRHHLKTNKYRHPCPLPTYLPKYEARPRIRITIAIRRHRSPDFHSRCPDLHCSILALHCFLDAGTYAHVAYFARGDFLMLGSLWRTWDGFFGALGL